MLLLGHVQSGRNVNVPESRGLSWSVSARAMSPIPSFPGYHLNTLGCHHNLIYVSFSDSLVLPSSMDLSRQGELVSAGFTGCRPPSIQGRLCQMGTSEMGEETSKVGTMRGRGFPGNKQSERSVPVVAMQLAASGRRAGVKSIIVAETTSPGFEAGKAQRIEEVEQDRERRPQEVRLARGGPAGGSGLLSEPMCLAWALGIRQWGVLGSNPSFARLLKFHSRPYFLHYGQVVYEELRPAVRSGVLGRTGPPTSLPLVVPVPFHSGLARLWGTGSQLP